MNDSVYLYGQILGTHSFFLKDGFLRPDEYSEISEKYFLPGGETGTAATVLASLGVQVKMDGRKGQPAHYTRPVRVEVRSTLGAGDTFKAGCVYGLLHHMTDEEIVRFAGACSAIAISRFPLPLNPPGMEEVQKLFGGGAYV